MPDVSAAEPRIAITPVNRPVNVRLKLDQRNVKTLPAGDRQRLYSDTLVPGLELRVMPTGVRTWYVRFEWRHRTARMKLERLAKLGVSKARELAKAAQLEAAQGRDPRTPDPEGAITVAALCEEALRRLDLKPSTRREWTRLFKVEIQPQAWAKLPAEALDRRTIRAWGERRAERSGSTALAAFEVLRRAYSWGVRRERVKATPFFGLEAPAQRRKADRVLSTDELRALWRALWLLDHLSDYVSYGTRDGQRGLAKRRREPTDRAYVDATRLLVLTAARREMVIGMGRSELEDLDGPGARWIIPASRMKADRDHVVPLSPPALAVIRRRLEMTSGELLFSQGRKPSHDRMIRRRDGSGGTLPAGRGPRAMTWSSRFVGSLRAMMAGILNKGVPRWTIHSLRHTAATHMTEDLGIDPGVVSLLLSHRPVGIPDVTAIYLRAHRLAERREALNRWGAWVEGLDSGPG